MVRARVARYGKDGRATVEIQRAKYKRWFAMGMHRETDAEFATALERGEVVWNRRIFEPPQLF